MKTKLFTGHFVGEKLVDRRFIDVDAEINEFLAQEKVELVDIKLSTCAQGEEIWNTALLIYKEDK